MNNIREVTAMTKPHICYYITAFLDLLGTSSRYNHLENIFKCDEIEIQSIVNSVISPLVKFRGTFDEFYKSYNNQQKTSKIQKMLRDVLKIEIPSVYIQNYSDSVILNLPLVLEHSRVPIITGLLAMVSACSVACFLSASEGILVRGGIELGEGIQISENEIIGCALSDAVRLEKKSHQPRIIIGPRLLKMLDDFSSLDILNGDSPPSLKAKPFQASLNKTASESIKKVIYPDEGQVYALDYIGVNEKGVCGERENNPLETDKIMHNLVRVIEVALINADYDLETKNKYVYLQNYVMSKIGEKEYTRMKVN